MADELAVLATIGGALSGKVGDRVFSHGPHGPYSYLFTPRVDPRTIAQFMMRLSFGTGAADWKSQPQDLRNRWNDYAANVSTVNRLGLVHFPSGYNRFCGVVSLRGIVGDFPPYHAPPDFTLARMRAPTYHLTIDPRKFVRVTWDLDDPWRSQDDGRFFIYQSVKKPTTVNYWTGPYSFLAVVRGSAAAPPTTQVFPYVHDLSDSHPRVFLRARVLDGSNRLSPANVQPHTYVP